MEHISIFIAFGAGVLSFLSPCVLPLIPAYISFISGLSVDELKGAEKPLAGILTGTVLFILGFSCVFVALGASATYISGFMLAHAQILRLVLGIIVIIFGCHLLGLFNLKFLQYEKRVHLKKRPANIFGSFFIGIAFAFGWTPCIGPILGSILTLAATKETIGQGILLLSAYSLGLGLPFLLTSIAIASFLAFFSKISKYFKVISVVSGILLIGVGILIIGDRL
ncbi:MAG: cytochrome c biogenesis protein CcdA [bacterium]|nr:cytochrome c biogenesis protein CcdA [bacterium]